MRRNNLKEIVAYIQKSAVRGSSSIGGGTGAGGTGGGGFPGKPAGGTGSGGTSGKTYAVRQNDILEMQKAIQEFAKEAVTYNYKDVRDEKTGKLKKTIDPIDKRRDFNDFLAEQFMASADIHGEEWTKDKAATTKESKLPTDIIQLNNVIDHLSRIGPGKSEEKVDGVWDFRTTNAVKNTYAFANAIVNAHEALGHTSPGDKNVFTKDDLNQLGQSIPPETEKNQTTLNEKAKSITPLVNKLTQFYKIYISRIMTHPAYAKYINQEYPLYEFTPGGTDPYKADPKDPNQKKFMENPKSFTLPTLTLTGKNGQAVNLNNKVTLESFQSSRDIIGLMTQYLGYSATEVNNPKLVTQVVRSILAQVKKFIDDNKKSVPSTQSTQSTTPDLPKRYRYSPL